VAIEVITDFLARKPGCGPTSSCGPYRELIALELERDRNFDGNLAGSGRPPRVAQQLNPLLRGWIAYYGRYAPSAMYPVLRYVNQTLVAWAMRKYKRFKRHKVPASQFLQRLATECVSLGVRFPGATLLDTNHVRHIKFVGLRNDRNARTVVRE
jgi:hypothetical protein